MRGSTLKDKIEWMITDKGFAAFLQLAATDGKGFWAVHDQEYSILKIPAGHLIFSCGHHGAGKDAKGAHGLRWSLLKHNNKIEVETTCQRMQHILETYPDLKGDEYTAWTDCLTNFLLPGVGGVARV